MSPLKEIIVTGGTGAQGGPVVKGSLHSLHKSRPFSLTELNTAVAESGRYSVRVLTRDPESARAKNLAALANVTLFQGQQDNIGDLRKAFRGVYGAWVNTDGFTLGEKNEIFYGLRAYEIARAAGVQHYICANIEYITKLGNWSEDFNCGHMNGKGRIGEFILALGQEGMTTSLFTTGPYMDALHGGLFNHIEQADGPFLFLNPASKL